MGIAKGFTAFGIEDRRTVEDTISLIDAVDGFANSADGFLDNTYVVELVCETLTDGSEKRSIRIRLAEQV